MRALLIASALLGVTTASAQERVAAPTSRPTAKARHGGFFGFRFVESRHGKAPALEIESVWKGSDAERIGLRTGDKILAVNGQPLENGDHFIKQIYATLPGPIGERSREMMKIPAPEGGPFLTVARDGKEVRIAGGLADLDAHPKVGETAPDFTLASADGKHKVALKKLCGEKPVVLVFGSFT